MYNKKNIFYIAGVILSEKKYSNLNDCVVDARDGVDGAFDALYSISYPYAYSAASHLLKKKEDIEDALQNSFFYVSRHISELRDTTAYLKWLNRIVINECKKILLNQKKHSIIFLIEKNRMISREESGDPDDFQIGKTDLAETVNAIIDKMKPQKKEVLKLYYFENLSYSEISKKLGIPIGTVMSRLYTAKKELEKEIKELQKDGTVLWSLPVLPLVAALLAYNVKAEIPVALIGQAAGGATAVSASAASASGTAGAAGASAAAVTSGAAGAGSAVAAVGGSVAVKAAVVAVTAAVAVGGGAVTKNIVKNRKPAPETSISETVEETKTSEDDKYFTDEDYLLTDDSFSIENNLSEIEKTEKSQIESSLPVTSEENTSSVSTQSTAVTEKESMTVTPAVGTGVEGKTRKSENNQTASMPASTAVQSSAEVTTVLSEASTEKSVETKTAKHTAAYKPVAGASTEKTSKTTTAPPASSTSAAPVSVTEKKPETTADSVSGLTVKEGVLNSYSGSGGAVNIPSTVNGQTVTAIGAGAFEGSEITSVSIPSGVTRIGQMAFSDCTKLTSVSLPSTLTGIGDCAFDGCSSLNTVTIPESVTDIGDDAFDGCNNLTIRCKEGSAAYDYAVENGIDYVLI